MGRFLVKFITPTRSFSTLSRGAAVALAVLTLALSHGAPTEAAGGPPPSVSIQEALTIADGRVQVTLFCQASEAAVSYPVGYPLRISIRQERTGASAGWRGSIACDGDGEGTAVLVQPRTGLFRPGNAEIVVFGTAPDPETGEPERYVFASETVRLVRSRGIG